MTLNNKLSCTTLVEGKLKQTEPEPMSFPLNHLPQFEQQVIMNSASDTLFEPGGRSSKRGQGGNQASATMSDLFSSFTRHISPAFNHERPDRSVQMRLYTMQKGKWNQFYNSYILLTGSKTDSEVMNSENQSD